MSSDHIGGPPNSVASVADSDLATGRIVDTISHSPYWKESAIFVIEDDTQNGVDHVDGARGPVQIISPWAQHGKVDSTYCTQITVIRTIEQILGIQPMNQKDSAATPMSRAFTRKPH
ncbi:alkaline phosphatase family protein [Nonomuraea sp. NPDC003201]